MDKIKDRKERLPEVYDTNFNIIADEIGVSDRTVSEAIYILECELGLIVTDVPYRTKNKDKEFRTPNTLFANAYKREHKYLLLTDEDYSRKELEQKESNLQKVYTKYKINKDKRKQRKG